MDRLKRLFYFFFLFGFFTQQYYLMAAYLKETLSKLTESLIIIIIFCFALKRDNFYFIFKLDSNERVCVVFFL